MFLHCLRRERDISVKPILSVMKTAEINEMTSVFSVHISTIQNFAQYTTPNQNCTISACKPNETLFRLPESSCPKEW